MVNGTTTGGSACCKLDRECGRDQLDALAVDTLKSWLGTLTSGSDSARAERHDAEIEGLKREIEKGRRSGSPKPAEEVFDRLERKYTQMAKDRGK